MTRNTLAYKTLEETRRSNLVNERQKANELAELISNNLRNHKINIRKNQIEALAKDQLNTREIAKLQEQIRSNLRNEGINDINAYANVLRAKNSTNLFGALLQYIPTNLLKKWGLAIGNVLDNVLDVFNYEVPVKDENVEDSTYSGPGTHAMKGNPSSGDGGGTSGGTRGFKWPIHQNERIGGNPDESIIKQNQTAQRSGYQSGGPGQETQGHSQTSGYQSTSRVIYSPGAARKISQGPGVGPGFI